MQKAQEDYHTKRTLADELCGSGTMSLESINLSGYLDSDSIQDESQITLFGCKPKATEECKSAALDHVLNLAKLFNDKNLPKCYNTSMITFDDRNSFNRFNDFLMFTRKDWVEGTPWEIGPLVENFKSSCK